MRLVVDINADLGESFGIYKIGRDEELLAFVTSANIACAMHASDPPTMQQTVALACQQNIGMGAHPGFPDMQGFGRRNLDMVPEEIYSYVLYQIGALYAFCRSQNYPLQHVKPHGALYNMAANHMSIAQAIAKAIKNFDAHLILLGLAGSQMIKAGREIGLKVAQEVFADRAYNSDGSLVSRTKPNSVLHDTRTVVPRVLKMLTERKVTSAQGQEICIQADSICIHGDNPQAIILAREIRMALTQAHIEIKPLGAFIR